MRSITLAMLLSLLVVSPFAIAESTDVAGKSGNPYVDSYKSRGLPAAILQPEADAPRIFRGEKKEDDYQRLLEQGYDLLGESSFDAAVDTAPELAREQALKARADVVMLYSKLIASTPVSVQIQQMRERMHQKQADPNAPEKPIEDQRRYAYYAAYWGKLLPPLIGVHVKQTKEETSGLVVVAVIRDSPAAQAGLQKDDVLTQIGEVLLDKPEALSAAARRYAGQTVTVKWNRIDVPRQEQMTLNQRR